MSRRSYGQYCGLAHALEMLGERWAMLIVRDLLASPRRFTDLLNGLPGIPTNVLSARLKELEAHGIARRRALPHPVGGVVYELTEYGADLEEPLSALSRWGVRSMGEPRSDDIVTERSLLSALRSTFRADRAAGLTVSYELRGGGLVLHAVVDDGKLASGTGPLPDADLVIEASPAIRSVQAGTMTPGEAIASGAVRVTGDPALLARFAEIFPVGPPPAN